MEMSISSIHRLGNVARFNRWSNKCVPWIAALAVFFIALGLYLALFASPADYLQGETVRIMYIHVPSAWLSMGLYLLMALASASWLIWRYPLADCVARGAAPIGATFAAITLITGAIWGKPMWGTWWVWDARLTSMLLLFFLYLGYIMLSQGIPITDANRKACAALSLLGAINLPIIKFSVEWWNTLHQPASVMRLDGPTIDSSMLVPLFVMFLGLALMSAVCLIWRMQTLLCKQKMFRLRKRAMQPSV